MLAVKEVDDTIVLVYVKITCKGNGKIVLLPTVIASLHKFLVCERLGWVLAGKLFRIKHTARRS